jgi:hypothetical protein
MPEGISQGGWNRTVKFKSIPKRRYRVSSMYRPVESGRGAKGCPPEARLSLLGKLGLPSYLVSINVNRLTPAAPGRLPLIDPGIVDVWMNFSPCVNGAMVRSDPRK